MKSICLFSFCSLALLAAPFEARSVALEPAAPTGDEPAKIEFRVAADATFIGDDGVECPLAISAICNDANGVWVTGDDGQQPVIMQLVGVGDPANAPGGTRLLQKVRVNTGNDDDADGHHEVMVFTNDDSGLKAGGPWLGVQFSPLPRPLAAQLKVEADVGLMVGNVFEGSPADVAGFQQYDVITAVDGQKVSSDIGAFLEKVRVFQPGENHTFSMIRGGQPVNATVNIGTRPAMDAMPKAKYESDMEEWTGGNVFGRGGMLQKDATGDWTFKGFNLPNVPDVMKMIPDVNDKDFTFNLAVPGPGSQQVYVGKTQGKSIRVEKKDDGPLTVTTTETVNGSTNTTTKTYANEDELKAVDLDAHKLLQNGPTMQFFAKPLDGKFQFRIGEAMKGHEEAMKHVEKAMKNLHGQQGVFGFAPGAHAGVLFSKAKTSFETLSDGKIRVTVRSGEDELVDLYDNADALKAARPELYEKYQSLQAEK